MKAAAVRGGLYRGKRSRKGKQRELKHIDLPNTIIAPLHAQMAPKIDEAIQHVYSRLHWSC